MAHQSAPDRGARPPTWQRERARRAAAVRSVLEVATALVVVGALAVPSLLWLPLVVVLPAGGVLAVQWLWAAWWRHRTAADGSPVVRAGVPRALSRRVPDPPALPEALARGTLAVTGRTWEWRPARGSAPDLARVVWDEDNLVDVTLRTTWHGLRPPHAHVVLRCPDGPVTVLVHDADRLGLLTWRSRQHERIG